MDDFSVIGSSIEKCLENPGLLLKRCMETNLVLKWEKCHFMVREGKVLGHRISIKGIEVDRAKIEVIEKLPPLTSMKGVSSFLGHAGFYRDLSGTSQKSLDPYLLFSCKNYLLILMIHA